MCISNYLEIIGSRVCEEISTNLFYVCRKSIEPWMKCYKEGGVVQNFGKEVDTLVIKILKNYEIDGILFRFTKAFKRKKKILERKIILNLQKLFERQVLKIKNASIQHFKEALAPVQITNKVEKEIHAIIKTVDYYFKEMAMSLVSRYSHELWFYQKEYEELIQEMKEISMERLQKAKLQGIHIQQNKNSIGLSFHFLHPHPFGKDSKIDYINTEDSFGFNSKFIPKAEITEQFASPRNSLTTRHISDQQSKIANDALVYNQNPLRMFHGNDR